MPQLMHGMAISASNHCPNRVRVAASHLAKYALRYRSNIKGSDSIKGQDSIKVEYSAIKNPF